MLYRISHIYSRKNPFDHEGYIRSLRNIRDSDFHMGNQYIDHKRWADILTQFATGLQNLEVFWMRNIEFEEGNLEPFDERGTAGTENMHYHAEFETLLNENYHVQLLGVTGGAKWIHVS